MKSEQNDIARQTRDEKLGEALARTLAETGVSGSCLSDEDLAALLDRTPAADELARLQSHIVSCDDCLARFTLASKLHVPLVHTERRNWYGYAAGLTAVAAALVAVFMARQQPAVQTAQNAPQTSAAPALQVTQPEKSFRESPQSEKTVSRTGKGEPLRSPAPTPLTAVALAEIVFDRITNNSVPSRLPAKNYGFSGSITPVKIAFRAGVATVDLGVALKGGDATARGSAVERLEELIGKDSEAMGIKELLREDATAEVRQRYLNVVNKIEQHSEKKGQVLTFRFGIWSEAGRLTDTEKLMEFVDRASIRTFTDGIKGDDMPESVRRSLVKLDALVASPAGTKKDVRLIKRTLDEIVEMY